MCVGTKTEQVTDAGGEKGGSCCFLASCLSTEEGGSGVKWRDLRENVSDILWLTDGKPLRRASYTDMRPFGDLCKHFNI